MEHTLTAHRIATFEFYEEKIHVGEVVSQHS